MVRNTLLLNTTLVSLQLLSMDNTTAFDFKKFFEEKDHGGKTYLHRTIKAGNINTWSSDDHIDEVPDADYLSNIKRTHPILLQSIIAHKVNVDIQDTKGRTPLYYAAKYKNEAATELLLQAGADPNIKDTLGLSPLIVAASIENNGSIITELLKHGAQADDLFASTPDIFVKDHEDEKTIETALKTCPVNAAALMNYFKTKKDTFDAEAIAYQFFEKADDYATILLCIVLLTGLY